MHIRRSTYKSTMYNVPGIYFVHGRFKTVNGADPTVKVGNGFTVARSAEGKWVITLTDDEGATMSFPALFNMQHSASLAAAAADAGDLVVHSDPIAENTAFSTVTLYLSQDGTDADVPGAWVHFTLAIQATEQTA